MRDQALESDPGWPWYRSLQGRDFSLASLRPGSRRPLPHSHRYRICWSGFASPPSGTGEAARLLNVAADALVEAGEAGIFTPCFLIHARKPGGDASSPS